MSYPNGTLVIEVVSLADEGVYSCNVENGVGESLNKNLWISVNSTYSCFFLLSITVLAHRGRATLSTRCNHK